MYNRSGFGDLAPSITFAKSTGEQWPTTLVSGESWVINITGPSNQPVWLVANQSGPLNMGTMDATGKLTLTGTVGPPEIGHWGELWYVGASQQVGQFLGSISFQVIAKPDSSGGGKTTTPPPPPSTTPFALSSIPTGVWIGAALLGFVVLLGGRR